MNNKNKILYLTRLTAEERKKLSKKISKPATPEKTKKLGKNNTPETPGQQSGQSTGQPSRSTSGQSTKRSSDQTSGQSTTQTSAQKTKKSSKLPLISLIIVIIVSLLRIASFFISESTENNYKNSIDLSESTTSETLTQTDPDTDEAEQTNIREYMDNLKDTMDMLPTGKGNLLMEDTDLEHVFHSSYSRSDIEKITFLNTPDYNEVSGETSSDAFWDVSAAGDDSIRAWVTDGELFIAANGYIVPSSCYALFYIFTNLKEI